MRIARRRGIDTPSSGTAQRGFTFVELMITVAIVTPLVVMSTWMLIQGLELLDLSLCRSELQINSQRVMESLIRELRSGTRTASSSPPNAVLLPAPANNQLLFYAPQDIDGNGLIIDALGDIEWGPAPIVFRHDAANGFLERVEGGVSTVLAAHVADVRFFDITADPALGLAELRIELQFERVTARQRPVREIIVGHVQMRN